ncbi:MAG: cation:H+ antiporter [Fusobacteriaceae bacterium]|jgi:cation:H+ antiporter|nr:sodium/calcium exchanger rane region [Fusobacteriales bacterium]MDN5303410.1 cation:H+ antiporter [Fusobacteriaceae bacterium]
MIYLLIFCVLAYLTIKTGQKLSVYGDAIGDIKELDKSWIGVVMLASITSLPEMITSIFATLLGHPDMAVSNIFGSNIFNVFIICILDVFIIRDICFTNKIDRGHLLPGFFSILISIFFIFGYIFKSFNIFHISIVSIIMFIIYLVSMRLIYNYQSEYEFEMENKIDIEIEEKPNLTYNQAKKGFIINAILIVLFGIGLSYTADRISITPIFGITLGASFVGTILLAVATSLPELTVSIQAVKLGAYDMSIGNILGSNLFNLSLLIFIDIFYFKGTMYDKLTEYHLISMAASVIMVLIIVLGTFFSKKKKPYDGYLVGIIYIISMYILYIYR